VNGSEDFLQHLRNTHFVLVVTALVIVVGLSSAQRDYGRALEQINDVIEAKEAITDEVLVERIRSQVASLRTWRSSDETFNVKDFLTEALVRRFDAAQLPDGAFDDVAVWDVFDEHAWHAGYDETLLEDYSFFYTHGAILAPKKGSFTYSFYNRGVSTSDLKSVVTSLNALLALQTLFHDPVYFSYFTGPTLFDAGGDPISWDELDQQFAHFAEPNVSVTLSKVELTTQTNRERILRTAEAAQDDSGVWETVEIAPDFFVLNCEISEGPFSLDAPDTPPVDLTIRLPVFFTAEAPLFLANLLRETFPERRYYARYISDGRTFADLFPELDALTEDLKSLEMKDLRNYLKRQASQGDAPITMLGIELQQDLVEVWGMLVLLGMQPYFSLHLQTFLGRLKGEPLPEYPWIGVYRDAVSRALFHASLALPLAVCLYLGWTQYRSAGAVQPLTVLYALLALGLFMRTQWQYLLATTSGHTMPPPVSRRS